MTISQMRDSAQLMEIARTAHSRALRTKRTNQNAMRQHLSIISEVWDRFVALGRTEQDDVAIMHAHVYSFIN